MGATTLENRRVFVSYVHQNRRLVRRLVHALADAGVDVWWDEEGLGAGAKWKREIRDAIQAGSFFIACFSQQYWRRNTRVGDGTYMNEELLIAVDRLRKLPLQRDWFIPVCLNRCGIPSYDIGADMSLQDLHTVHMWRDWSVGLQRIVEAVLPSGSMPPELRAELLRLTSESPAARCSAAEALGKLGDARAVPQLTGALRDADASVRRRALWALASLREPAVVPALVDLLGEPPGTGPDAGAAIRALGEMGSPAVVDPLLRVVRRRSIDSWTKTQAARVLVSLGCMEVAPMLKSWLLTSAADEWSRHSAATELLRLDETNGVRHLVNLLSKPDAVVRRAAAAALADSQLIEARDPLVSALEDEDDRVRVAAVRGLGRRKTRSVMPHLLPMIDDAAPSVRVAAITALCKLKEDAVAAAVLARADDPEAAVRFAVARALGRMKNAGGMQVLVRMLWDDGLSPGEIADEYNAFVARDIRSAAAYAIHRVGDPHGIRAVEEAARNGAFVVSIEV